MDPLTFFLWNKPRLLIDLRPIGAFNKGSLENAQSFPVCTDADIEHLIIKFSDNERNQSLHLIDLDGKTSEFLSKKLPIDFLEGGYKGFKQWRRQAFKIGPQIRVLSGYSGSGKTEILKQLKDHGHQVINLEELATHKGSVFGASPNTMHCVLHYDFINPCPKYGTAQS